VKIQNGISLQPPNPEAKTAERDASLRDAAKMYEKHFLNEMVKAMRSTVQHDDGIMKKNFAEKIFSEQLDQQYVDSWGNKGGVGLADMIYNQIHDQYYGANHKQINGLQQMLPIAPQKNFKIPASTDSIQMKTIPSQGPGKLGYRFEVPAASGGTFEVQAPMAGKIAKVERLEDNWNLLSLDHGQGLRSELTFPGQVTETGLGQELAPGQRLGVLDPNRPVLVWNLEES